MDTGRFLRFSDYQDSSLDALESRAPGPVKNHLKNYGKIEEDICLMSTFGLYVFTQKQACTHAWTHTCTHTQI